MVWEVQKISYSDRIAELFYEDNLLVPKNIISILVPYMESHFASVFKSLNKYSLNSYGVQMVCVFNKAENQLLREQKLCLFLPVRSSL